MSVQQTNLLHLRSLLLFFLTLHLDNLFLLGLLLLLQVRHLFFNNMNIIILLFCHLSLVEKDICLLVHD